MTDPAIRTTDPAVRMYVVHAKHRYGRLYFALVPADLGRFELLSAFKEVDLNVDQLAEICEWRMTSQGIGISSVSLPGQN